MSKTFKTVVSIKIVNLPIGYSFGTNFTVHSLCTRACVNIFRLRALHFMSLIDDCTSYGKVLLNKQLFLTYSECFCTETEFSEKPKEFEFRLRKTRASKGYYMRVCSIYEPLKIFSVDSHEMFVTERFENSAIKFYNNESSKLLYLAT